MPPEGSDLIFDHRHNADERACGLNLATGSWGPPISGRSTCDMSASEVVQCDLKHVLPMLDGSWTLLLLRCSRNAIAGAPVAYCPCLEQFPALSALLNNDEIRLDSFTHI